MQSTFMAVFDGLGALLLKNCRSAPAGRCKVREIETYVSDRP
jgi:hypothetical protein